MITVSEYVELVGCFVENGSIDHDAISVLPIKGGTRYYGDGDSWTRWSVFRRSELTPQMVAQIILINGPHYGGPGQAFNDCVSYRISNSYVLITQRGGYDV